MTEEERKKEIRYLLTKNEAHRFDLDVQRQRVAIAERQIATDLLCIQANERALLALGFDVEVELP